ncbi:MAG TPA: FAD-dependent oxidoreductase [Ilumatobacter sp.]|nr:FAD-dependent oxidoreductase [Ilumatobacter sp.]
MLERVVIVGASLAGLRAAESLRQAGHAGTITMIGAESHLPYDRPPLSKRLLAGDWDVERIQLRKPEGIDELNLDWRLGVSAIRLDLNAREIALSDGTSVAFDGAILATGSQPRRLPGQLDHPHVFELRTLDDSLALRERLANGGQRMVVVGAGFIGLEAAATAKQLGNDVLVVEGAPAPLIRALGAEQGTAVAAIHGDHGVEIRTGVTVDGLAEGGLVINGEFEPADVVLVGIGVIPATDWLDDSGLELRDGVVCAADLNVGAPLVYAAGDMVRWYNALFDEEMRIEHWTNAAEQGAIAAQNLLAEAAGEPTERYAPVPFFWSEQYDKRIQFLGRASADDDVHVIAGSVEDRKYAALFGRDGKLRGVLGVNMPKHVMPYRARLLEGISLQDAIAMAAPQP